MSHFQNIAPSIATLLKKESEVLSDIAAIKRAIQFVPPPPPSIITSYLHSLNSSAFLQINVLLVMIGKKYRINFKNYKILPTRKVIQYSGNIDQVPNLLGAPIQLYTHFEILCPPK